ncbi:MAG TPA: hypothetical protein PLJ78_08320 [Anaerolineae bacterium]|nr:hypothetical protein [Anaerolineae bacterium]HQK13930.1 hypothetical protein [Anaerolineae bacterium]
MFPTVEVRWFYPGVIPQDVLAWYHYGERAPEGQPPRIDYYLRLAGQDDLNIKLREGRIEIKQRAKQYGVEQLHAHVSGLVEVWHKWSFGVSDTGSGLGDLTGPRPAWIAVRKARRLRRYLVTDGGEEVIAIAGSDIIAQGCNIELAEIKLGEEIGWSLAFETFGPEATLHATFTRVVQHVLRGDSVPFLDTEHSYGYARWLKSTCDV